MWVNKAAQPKISGASPATGVETPTDSSRPTSANMRATAWLGPSLRVKGEISGNEDRRVARSSLLPWSRTTRIIRASLGLCPGQDARGQRAVR